MAQSASLNVPQERRSPVHLVKPLRWSDIWRVSETLQLSAHPDPFYVYRYETADPWRLPFRHLREKLYFCLILASWVHRETGYTIGGGQAIVSMESGRPKGIIDKVWDGFLHAVERVLCILSREQIKKGEEMEDTMKNLVEKTFGKDAEDMVIINSLATHPSARGRGYGGALVDYVSQRADEQQRSTYLFSSNPVNAGFYRSHGYNEMAVSFLGDANPAWKMSAVRCPLLCRRCR